MRSIRDRLADVRSRGLAPDGSVTRPGHPRRDTRRSGHGAPECRMLWCAGLLTALAASPALGQELFDSGMDLVVQGLQRGAVVNVTSSVSARSDDRCMFRGQILQAEAERALRRDGVAAQPLSGRAPSTGSRFWTADDAGNRLVAELSVDVIALEAGVRLCAVSLDVQLRVLDGSSAQDLVILAADDGQLLVWMWPEHVTRIRRAVEEKVSVIANAIRSRGGAR